MDGQYWLAQAATGGLPEPTLKRWQPLRVGIENLWEYDDAQFWFADGRLVLRGGNGAGKTKVLELTTLMLLRGEITPSVLDPFGSQHRTMRYNLLPTGEADDPRPPADSGLGYAWVEFGRRDSTGQAHFFVCGVGASARRGTGTSGVIPWRFVTHLRPGAELALTRAGRPLEQKELNKVAGVDVLDTAARYRARLAAELFELDTAAYDNLTELLKHLRRPKLGERLNPGTLAATLRNALPPLATNEVDQLAEGWDRLEKLRLAVEATKEAAKQVAGFVRAAWLPWVRIVVRQRADTFTTARTALEKTTRDKGDAEQQLRAARAEVDRLDGNKRGLERDHSDASTALRELLESGPYRDAVNAAGRIEGHKNQLKSLSDQLTDAEKQAERERDEHGRRETAATKAEAKAADARQDVDRCTTAILEAAEPAGLAASAERHVSARAVPALRADLQRRSDRLTSLRRLHAAHDMAARKADLSAQTVRNRQDDHKKARAQADAARHQVEGGVEDLQQRIREWAAATTVVRCPPEEVELWCDLVAEMSASEGARSASPVAAIRAHAEVRKSQLRGRREELLRQRDPLETEHREVSARLAEVKIQRDIPPPAPQLWRRAARPEAQAGAGAPLWRCVEPRDGVSPDDLDLLEATLAASGLLDAWLTPDGTLRTEDGTVVADTGLRVRTPTASATLAAVLRPTPAGGVTDRAVAAALDSIGWHDTALRSDDADVWLANDGSWRVGVLTGRATSRQPASFLGATTRAAARQREVASLEFRLAGLAEQIDKLSAAISGVKADLAVADDELQRLPPEMPVTDSIAMWRERSRRVDSAADDLDQATARHSKNETSRDNAWAEFSSFAGEHGFPLRDLDSFAAALNGYREALGSFELALSKSAHLEEAAALAAQECNHQAGLVAAADRAEEKLTADVRRATVKLRTAEEALSSGHAEQLSRKDDLDADITRLAETVHALDEQLTEAKIAAASAKTTLATHEERRSEAERHRDAALAAWWELYDADLARAVGLSEPERRVVETGRAAVIEARKELAQVTDEHAATRALRRCDESLHELKQQLLPNRDARAHDDADVPRFLVLADSEVGWQMPDDAADALAEQVRQQEAHFDAEQQQVLATLLGSTFIEHLKERLDYTERTFTAINARLAAHATRHGHAVRLRHEPDPADPSASEVVTALNQGYQQLSPNRQDMVRSFLARKIDEARADAAADQVADWKEQLSAALDYRRWLRISLEYRPGTQAKWRPFDRAQHGAKSGGEKVVLLSQPLFAATVVAYDAAGDHAPRWVWLDEAMTGVDGQYKASFMGLTVNFDLDVMLTAHDEWCTYPTVPAVAVYDLARSPHLPGVDAQPHLWCGGEMTEVVIDTPSAANDLLVEDGLFADHAVES